MSYNRFKNTNAGKCLKDLFTTGMCRPVTKYRMSTNDCTRAVLKYLNKDMVILGNDAPRGGKTGNYIKLKYR